MLAMWKRIQVFSLIGFYFFVMIWGVIFIRGPLRRRHFQIRWQQKLSQITLRVLGFYIRPVIQDPDLRQTPGQLIVCNHLSYMDILILSAFFPCVFVTSVEIQQSGFLGWIAKSAGCLFVERRSRENRDQEALEIARMLKLGFSVVLFPEATSTDGSSVLPFKNSMFQSAIEAKKPVLPICLNYRRVNRHSFSSKNRDRLFFYGDMDFFPHLMKLTRQSSVEVEMVLCPTIPWKKDFDRKSLAQEAERRIRAVYVPISADHTVSLGVPVLNL